MLNFPSPCQPSLLPRSGLRPGSVSPITCGNVAGAPPYSWQKLAECELACSGTIDARFCAWRTPGGVKSVNLCELSVPGTEARCRANHGSARCSRAGATAGGRTEMRGGNLRARSAADTRTLRASVRPGPLCRHIGSLIRHRLAARRSRAATSDPTEPGPSTLVRSDDYLAAGIVR